MIVMIGGKAINPEHVTNLEYRGGNTSTLVHLVTGKYVEVSLPHKATMDAINEASWPARRIVMGADLVGIHDDQTPPITFVRD